MPYPNPKQAQAVFLSIKREKGEAAAKKWGRKHRADLSKAARYTPRSARSH